MQCERCHQKPATVKIVKIVNGEKNNSFYCEDCAMELELDAPISLQDFFKGMLDMTMNSMKFPSGTPKTQIKSYLSCSSCGTTYEQFRKKGKLGCINCYTVFRSQLEAILKSVHGSSEHNGKIPKKLGQAFIVKKQVEAMRKQIVKAVECEDYEKAAELRDKIRELTREGN